MSIRIAVIKIVSTNSNMQETKGDKSMENKNNSDNSMSVFFDRLFTNH